MTYLVVYAERSNASDKAPDLGNLTSMEFEEMGHAIEAACILIKKGATVWQITNREGFMMERSDIENECSRRAVKT